MRRRDFLLGVGVASVLVGGPWTYGSYLYRNFRNFHVVKPGVLYRSGQLSLYRPGDCGQGLLGRFDARIGRIFTQGPNTPAGGLAHILHDYGIRTVVSLRDDYTGEKLPPDQAEEEYCTAQGMKYVRLHPKVWHAVTPGGPIPGQANIDAFLKVMDDPANHPVLIHCYAGCHRTGIHCAVYRMEYDRWDVATAIEEMRRYGYTRLDEDEDVHEFLAGYVPRWRRR